MAKKRSKTRRVSRKSRSTSKRVLRLKDKSRKSLSKSSVKRNEPRAETNKSKSKKKSKKSNSSYTKFVKEMSPKLRKANPSLKQPQIMKLIAKEWKKMPLPESK